MADVKVIIGAKFIESEWDLVSNLHPEEYLDEKSSSFTYDVLEGDEFYYVIGRRMVMVNENTCDVQSFSIKEIQWIMDEVRNNMERIGLKKEVAIHIVPDFIN